MSREKEYTPERLEKAAWKYLNSISRYRAVTERVPTGERDDKGRMIYEEAPVYNKTGDKVIISEYVEPPTVGGLCAALNISRQTWTLYANHELRPEYTDVTEAIRAELLAWNERELLTRPGPDIKGIVFNLQNNYGYTGDKLRHEFEDVPTITLNVVSQADEYGA